MSAVVPSDGDLEDALLATVESNDLDDALGGWWGCVHLGEDLYGISFSDGGKEMARWEVKIVVQRIS
jgi:hypothetical protein